ncbi:ABC transporter ATP-binding protein [bacterium]|nr:ABC transporter ATP-binding protein [bacterium]
MVKIELIGLRKYFGGKPVLRDVNLVVHEGETLVVIGRSGCGKSVMLKHMVGLMKPDAGRVFVGGEDIIGLNEHQLFRIRNKIGFLFQGGALLDSLTVGENVGLGLSEHLAFTPSEIQRIVSEKLNMVGMGGIEKYMPSDLSGGMKKRVALARAIAMNPEIVMYDEPTTGLDPIMADSINELIIFLKKMLNITSVVVTHDMSSVRKIADRVAMLHNGEIVFTGTPEELDATDNEVVRQFVEGRVEGPIKLAVKRYITEYDGQGSDTDFRTRRIREDITQ